MRKRKGKRETQHKEQKDERKRVPPTLSRTGWQLESGLDLSTPLSCKIKLLAMLLEKVNKGWEQWPPGENLIGF